MQYLQVEKHLVIRTLVLFVILGVYKWDVNDPLITF